MTKTTRNICLDVDLYERMIKEIGVNKMSAFINNLIARHFKTTDMMLELPLSDETLKEVGMTREEYERAIKEEARSC